MSRAVNLKKGRRIFKPEILILYYALQHKQTPFYAKLPAIFSLLYLLSPVDLIPDVIPFFGYVDDLFIVPLLLQLSVSLLPAQVKQDSIAKATLHARKLKIIAVLCIVVAIALVVWIFFIVKRLIWG